MKTTHCSAVWRTPCWIALLGALITSPLAAQPRIEPVPGDYRIVGGKVDRGTYTGWRLFHTACYGCHGVGGIGTDLAPNLVERVKELTPRAFAAKVLTSYRIVQPADASSAADRSAAFDALIEEVLQRERRPRSLIAMPAWDDDPEVSPHVLDLYAYLSARADGALGPGKPKR